MLILNQYTSGCLLMWLWMCRFSFNVVYQPGLCLCGTLPGCHLEAEAWICQSATPTDGCNLLPSTLSVCLLIKGKFILSQTRQVLFLWWWKVGKKYIYDQKQLFWRCTLVMMSNLTENGSYKCWLRCVMWLFDTKNGPELESWTCRCFCYNQSIYPFMYSSI